MTASDTRGRAFTRIELMVVVIAFVLIIVLLAPAFSRAHAKSSRIACIGNLKTIGTAYRIFSNDHSDSFPTEVRQVHGGWRELLSTKNASAYAWTNYAAMDSELGLDPKILICPSDERQAATTFSNLSNINLSYFIGPGASDDFPQALLGGDRNLSPGNTPHDDYGFSPPDGRGNDVTIKGHVCWSLKMHSAGNSSEAGNILLGDGSAQQVTSGNLNLNWLKPAMEAYANLTNGPASSNGIRLIFP